MLKVKDNIDLKILEKYGFVLDENTNSYVNNECDMWICEREDGNFIYNISIMPLLDLNSYQELLYDLIKADLVEKVDDNK